MDFEPLTGMLWTAVNERDELGGDLVPDYMTAVEDGAFYGWPWSYYGDTVDTRVQPPRPDKVAQAQEKPSLAGWFVGQVMKATGGKANPQAVQAAVKAKLGL